MPPAPTESTMTAEPKPSRSTATGVLSAASVAGSMREAGLIRLRRSRIVRSFQDEVAGKRAPCSARAGSGELQELDRLEVHGAAAEANARVELHVRLAGQVVAERPDAQAVHDLV